MPQTYTVSRLRVGQVGADDLSPADANSASNIGPRVTPNYEANLRSTGGLSRWVTAERFLPETATNIFILTSVFSNINLRSARFNGGIDKQKAKMQHDCD